MTIKYCPTCKKDTETSCCACGCGECYTCHHRFFCMPPLLDRQESLSKFVPSGSLSTFWNNSFTRS